MKGLVLGLGNEILSDDGVGIVVTRHLREFFKNSKNIDFIETNEMGLSLLDFLEGYEWAIIVDSVITGTCKTGSLHVFDRDTFTNPQAGNLHHMGLDEILTSAERMNISVPRNLYVAAIEVKDPFTFGEKLTLEVEKALPQIVCEIREIIKKIESR